MLTYVVYYFFWQRFWQRVLNFPRLASGMLYMCVCLWHINLNMSGQARANLASSVHCLPTFYLLASPSPPALPPAGLSPSLPATRDPLTFLEGMCRVVVLSCCLSFRAPRCWGIISVSMDVHQMTHWLFLITEAHGSKTTGQHNIILIVLAPLT